MADHYSFRTEIEQILCKNARSHFAKRFLGLAKWPLSTELLWLRCS
jgi:hypothetical protein